MTRPAPFSSQPVLAAVANRLARTGATVAVCTVATVVGASAIAERRQFTFVPAEAVQVVESGMHTTPLPPELRAATDQVVLVRGRVHNTGDTSACLVKAVVTFVDRSGSPVSIAAGFIARGTLPRGADASFEVVTSPDPRITSYVLRVEEARERAPGGTCDG